MKTKQPKRKLVRPRWESDEVQFLIDAYPDAPNAEIARVIGRRVSSIVFKAHRLGLCKSAERLRQMGQENISKRWGKRRNRRKAA